MASEGIGLQRTGLAPPNALKHPLSPGYHEIRFVFDSDLGEYAKLYLDGIELLDLTQDNSDGGFLDEQFVWPSKSDKDWILFRGIDMASDQFFETQKGPGALLWIE